MADNDWAGRRAGTVGESRETRAGTMIRTMMKRDEDRDSRPQVLEAPRHCEAKANLSYGWSEASMIETAMGEEDDDEERQ